MKNKLKKLFDAYIEKKIELFFSKNMLNTESPILKAGTNAVLLRPMKIAGHDHIQIGTETYIGRAAWIEAITSYCGQPYKPAINIGNNVYIGNYCCITAIDEVNVGDGCMISDYFYCSDHSHGTNPESGLPPARQPLHSKGKIAIGRNSFIGYRVSILPGVELGKNCVVGAHSVVTKSFGDNSVIAGVPARLIKYL